MYNVIIEKILIPTKSNRWFESCVSNPLIGLISVQKYIIYVIYNISNFLKVF